MKDNSQKPNFLHYIGFGLFIVGWFLLLQLMLVEGFSAWFLGCGIGLLGCELDKEK